MGCLGSGMLFLHGGFRVVVCFLRIFIEDLAPRKNISCPLKEEIPPVPSLMDQIRSGYISRECSTCVSNKNHVSFILYDMDVNLVWSTIS